MNCISCNKPDAEIRWLRRSYDMKKQEGDARICRNCWYLVEGEDYYQDTDWEAEKHEAHMKFMESLNE